MIDNANLVKKVSFPREILPLVVDRGRPRRLRAAVGRAAAVHRRDGYGIGLEAIVLYPMAFVTLMVFTAAITPGPPR